MKSLRFFPWVCRLNLLFTFIFVNLCLQVQAQTVHILMPVFNSEQYLRGSLESVFNQTYQDIRLIAYNDGSTEGSQGILENYADRFGERCVLLQTPINQGISNARKCLLGHSQELDENAMILWLDSDDFFIDSVFIENFVNQMQKTEAEVCLFNFEIVFEDESQIGNAKGLLIEQEASEKVLNAIHEFPNQTISPIELPSLMNFTSLGWTKGYHQIKIPQPAKCPYEDFVYMAVLLNASKITSFPAYYKPIRYLRRAQSITGKRSAATFDAVLTQLETFIKEVDSIKKIEYYFMIKAFLERKIDQYEDLLKQLVSEKQHSDLTEKTLEAYQKRAAQLLNNLMLTCTEEDGHILKERASHPQTESVGDLPQRGLL